MPLGCEDIIDWEAEQTSVALPAVRAQLVPEPLYAELVNRLHQAAKAMEPKITPVLRALLQHVQGHLHGDGPELHRHVFKKPASTHRKIELLRHQHALPPEQAAARVRDALRYEVVLQHEGFVASVQWVSRQLQSEGLEVMRINNTFATADTTYAGLNMNLRSGHITSKSSSIHPTVFASSRRHTGCMKSSGALRALKRCRRTTGRTHPHPSAKASSMASAPQPRRCAARRESRPLGRSIAMRGNRTFRAKS